MSVTHISPIYMNRCVHNTSPLNLPRLNKDPRTIFHVNLNWTARSIERISIKGIQLISYPNNTGSIFLNTASPSNLLQSSLLPIRHIRFLCFFSFLFSSFSFFRKTLHIFVLISNIIIFYYGVHNEILPNPQRDFLFFFRLMIFQQTFDKKEDNR